MKAPLKKLSACAMLCAISSAFLLLGSFFPSGKLALCAAAGLLPMLAAIHFGVLRGFEVYAVSAALSWLIDPDKMLPFIFSVFLGLYPVLKTIFDAKISLIVLRWVIKLLFFLIIFSAVLYLAADTFFPGILSVRAPWILLPALGCVVFAVYDIGLSALSAEYKKRFSKYIKQ